jgi:ubiquinone/menaquinone biosynthesis C-methylase UbiE
MKPPVPPARRDIVAEYAHLAPSYDERWAFYIEGTTRETLARLTLKPGDRLLDVGCGTGALLHRLSRSHPAALLTGLDPVPEMLAVARGRLPPEVELREGWAERLPFGDEEFDAVVSCNVFHYIPQPSVALSEMRRVLRRGGRLVLTDWCDDYLACRICGWWLRRLGRANFKIYREVECRRLLRQAGHHPADIQRYKLGWLWGLMTARATKAGGTLPPDVTPWT